LSRNPPPTPDPINIPTPLPPELIAERLARAHPLLCLDFDGTISELTNDPWKAVPIPRAKDAIAELARHPHKITVAIVSGRDLDTLIRLLGLRDGLMFAGAHGLELIGHDAVRHFAPGVERCADDMKLVREFLAKSIPKDRGFIVEDKGMTMTINYRNAKPDDARPVLEAFDNFVSSRPTLQVLHGKMVHEALPRGIGGKGAAIEFFMRDTGIDAPNTIYIGDDTTDEDAFGVLAPRGGITVMVGAARPSFAEYRVDTSSVVADLLVNLTSATPSL
jgi:trehalose-phosphatase